MIACRQPVAEGYADHSLASDGTLDRDENADHDAVQATGGNTRHISELTEVCKASARRKRIHFFCTSEAVSSLGWGRRTDLSTTTHASLEEGSHEKCTQSRAGRHLARNNLGARRKETRLAGGNVGTGHSWSKRDEESAGDLHVCPTHTSVGG